MENDWIHGTEFKVGVKVKPSNVTPDFFDWLEGNDLHFIHDWYYSKKPHWDKSDADYIFVFKREEDATIFALRWV